MLQQSRQESGPCETAAGNILTVAAPLVFALHVRPEYVVLVTLHVAVLGDDATHFFRSIYGRHICFGSSFLFHQNSSPAGQKTRMHSVARMPLNFQFSTKNTAMNSKSVHHNTRLSSRVHDFLKPLCSSHRVLRRIHGYRSPLPSHSSAFVPPPHPPIHSLFATART